MEQELEALSPFVSLDASQLDVGTDIQAQITRAVTEMVLERKKREDIEHILADVERECRHPTIVPALLQTMDEMWLDMT